MEVKTIEKYFVKAPQPAVGSLSKIAVGSGDKHWSIVNAKFEGKNFGVVHWLDTFKVPGEEVYKTGWKPVPLPEGVSAVDVDCADDGTIIAVGKNGSAYRYIESEGEFRNMNITGYKFKEVSVGSNNYIFFSGQQTKGKANTIFRYLGEKEVVPFGNNIGQNISVGENGTLCYLPTSGQWILKVSVPPYGEHLVPHECPIHQVSIGKDDRSIFFVGKNDELGQALHDTEWVLIDPKINKYTKPTDPKIKMGAWGIEPFPAGYTIKDINSSAQVDLALLIKYTPPSKKGDPPKKPVSRAYFSIKNPIIS